MFFMSDYPYSESLALGHDVLKHQSSDNGNVHDQSQVVKRVMVRIDHTYIIEIVVIAINVLTMYAASNPGSRVNPHNNPVDLLVLVVFAHWTVTPNADKAAPTSISTLWFVLPNATA